MAYDPEIFERLKLRNISAFLRNGRAAPPAEENLSYLDRVDAAEQTLLAKCQDCVPDEDAYRELADCIHAFADTIQGVYMEIGMQCGAVVMNTLLHGEVQENKE